MKRLTSLIALLVITSLSAALIQAQKYVTANPISESDLESHVSFLASPLLKGRMNGEEGLEIAGSYLAAQAKNQDLNRQIITVSSSLLIRQLQHLSETDI